MSSLAKALFALVLFGAWALGFLVLGWLATAFAVGLVGLSANYEMPIMGGMLLLCILTYAFVLNFVLAKVSR